MKGTALADHEWNENDCVRDQDGRFADKPGSKAEPKAGTATMPYDDGDTARDRLAAHAHEIVDAMPDGEHTTDRDQSCLRAIALDSDPCDTRLTREICEKGDADTIESALNNRFMDDGTFREHGSHVHGDAKYLSDAQQLAVNGDIPRDPHAHAASDEQLHAMLISPDGGYRRIAIDSNMGRIIRSRKLWDVAASDPDPLNRRRLAENCGLPDGHPCRIGAYRGIVAPAPSLMGRTPEGMHAYRIVGNGEGMHLEHGDPAPSDWGVFRSTEDGAGWMRVDEQDLEGL